MNEKKISVIGLGYIGLPTAAILASKNFCVLGVDLNQDIVESVNSGRSHINEPELADLVNKTVSNGYLTASTKPENSDVFLIAVPTPSTKNKKSDLSFVLSAAKSIAPFLSKGNLIIIESTCPVGTSESLAQKFEKMRPDLSFPHKDSEKADINISYCPERVLPGNILHELSENDRIIGGMSPKCSKRSIEIYKSFVRGKFYTTNAKTAELTKLTENAYRDVNIAFANELSILCDSLEIDIWELIHLANKHPRVNLLKPGPGVGGHCIAVDPWFIIEKAPKETTLIKAARKVNDYKPQWVIKKVISKAQEILLENPDRSLSDLQIMCLGLTFKANVSDLRQSPAVRIVEELISELRCRISVIEPYISRLPPTIEGAAKLLYLGTPLKKYDLVLLLVDHDEFNTIDYELLKNNQVIDTRGLLKPNLKN